MKTLGALFLSSRFLVLGDQVLFSGTNFLVTIGLARFLSLVDFGFYSSVLLGAYLLVSLSNALILQPFQVSGKKQQGSAIYSHFLFSVQLIFITTTLVVAGITSLLVDVPALGAMALFVAGLLLHDFARKILIAKNLLRKVIILDGLLALCQLLMLLPVANGSALSFVFLLLGISYLPGLIFFIRDLNPNLKHLAYFGRFAAIHKKEGLWLGLISLIQWGSGNLLVASAGFFIGLQALAAFRLIQSLFGLLTILFQTFENYVLPAASRMHSVSAILSKNYIRKTSLQSALLIGVVLFILFVFSDQVIDLVSAGKYTAYGYVVKGMCLLYFIVFLGYPFRLGIRLLLLNKSFFTGYLLSFAFSVVFFSGLVREWQLNGIIAGLIANQVIMIAFWSFQLNKQKFILWK